LFSRLKCNNFIRARACNTQAKRKGEVQARYGDLRSARLEYGGFQGREWLVEWERTPQPMRLRLDLMRGARDRLPQGRYVLVVSLRDRLGGSELRWSQLRRHAYNASSLPVIHDGRFTDVELRFGQSVYVVLPSEVDMSPSNVYVFELFLLKGKHARTDTVVAWGAFPTHGNTLKPSSGRKITPLMRGPVDDRISTFMGFSDVIGGGDGGDWIANLYFRAEVLARGGEWDSAVVGGGKGNPWRGDEEQPEDGFGEPEDKLMRAYVCQGMGFFSGFGFLIFGFGFWFWVF
jgi:hypothetical protein